MYGPRAYAELTLRSSHLGAGGYIEHTEYHPDTKSDDGSITEGSPWDTCNKLVERCDEAFGKTFLIQEKMRDLMEEAGFVDIVETKFKWPIGPWGTTPKLKDIGRWNMAHWLEGMEGWTLALLTRILGVSQPKILEQTGPALTLICLLTLAVDLR